MNFFFQYPYELVDLNIFDGCQINAAIIFIYCPIFSQWKLLQIDSWVLFHDLSSLMLTSKTNIMVYANFPQRKKKKNFKIEFSRY